MKKGDIVKVRLLTSDGKSQEIVERKIIAISASGTTVQIQGLDNKMKWTPITNVLDLDDEEPKVEKVKAKKAEPVKVEEPTLAEKAAEVLNEAEVMSEKAKKKLKEKPEKIKTANLKQQVLSLMKEGKTNEEIKELHPSATSSYISQIRSDAFEWKEPNPGTTKKVIIDAHKAGKTVEEIVTLSGSSEGHVKFQINAYKKFHS